MNELKSNPTLTDLQLHLDAVCKDKGWDKNSITEVFLLFTEEVGELARAVRKQTGVKAEKKPDNTQNLTEELADVLNYLLEIANRFNIDLEHAYREKHKTNNSRIWH